VADRVIAMGVADPESPGRHGMERRCAPRQQADHLHDAFQGALVVRRCGDWISLYGQSDTRGDRDLWLGGSLWQKDAPIESYWSSRR
jgi:hypothetical protein